jgi:hypothetical protein
MKNWRILEVQNEIFRRRRNEWIEQASDSYDAGHIDDIFVCECGDSDCSEKVSLTRVEYEAVRSQGSRFVIAINHENPEIERVTFENGRFAIVQKMMAAGRMSQETNPRR